MFDHDLTFDIAEVTFILKVFCGALVIRVQALVIEVHTEWDDHFNGGTVSLGPIPSCI